MRKTTDSKWPPFVLMAAGLAIALVAACDDSPTRSAADVELDRVRSATERYVDIAHAIADGYVDIDVIMPNMGHHYLNESLLDDTFDVERPEILVYMPDGDEMRLVAVEYAVPRSLAEFAPMGFTGAADVWDRNTTFQLWTLHAWVWRENPNGVFAPLNPTVP
jgi:hypothetical protein